MVLSSFLCGDIGGQEMADYQALPALNSGICPGQIELC